MEECVYLTSDLKLLAILGIPFFYPRLIKLMLWSPFTFYGRILSIQFQTLDET